MRVPTPTPTPTPTPLAPGAPLALTDVYGRFKMPDHIPENERERFAPVKAAYDALQIAEAAELVACDAVAAELEKITAAEAILAKQPTPTFRDLWLQSVSRKDKHQK